MALGLLSDLTPIATTFQSQAQPQQPQIPRPTTTQTYPRAPQPATTSTAPRPVISFSKTPTTMLTAMKATMLRPATPASAPAAGGQFLAEGQVDPMVQQCAAAHGIWNAETGLCELQPGMSTTTKLIIGGVVLAGVGALVYFLTRKKG